MAGLRQCGGVARAARGIVGIVVPRAALRCVEAASELQLPRGPAAAAECGAALTGLPRPPERGRCGGSHLPAGGGGAAGRGLRGGGVERRPGSRRAVARAPLSPVGPGLGPLWGGGVPAAQAGWGRAADVCGGGAHLFSWPRAFSWRFRATAASGLEGSLVGTRCEPPKMDPDSGPAPRRAATRAPGFCVPPRCPQGCGDGKGFAAGVKRFSWDPRGGGRGVNA